MRSTMLTGTKNVTLNYSTYKLGYKCHFRLNYILTTSKNVSKLYYILNGPKKNYFKFDKVPTGPKYVTFHSTIYSTDRQKALFYIQLDTKSSKILYIKSLLFSYCAKNITLN